MTSKVQKLEEQLAKIREWASEGEGRGSKEGTVILELLGDTEPEEEEEGDEEDEGDGEEKLFARYDKIWEDIGYEGFDYYFRGYTDPEDEKIADFDPQLAKMWEQYIVFAERLEHHIKTCGGRRAESK